MKRFQLPATLAALAVAWAWCLPVIPAYGQDDFEDRIAAEQEEGVELLARGPVHEAFAEPIVDNPEGTLIISLQPPEAIDEVPPEYKPEGDNVIWIPGYWAWEDERKDFIWISGIWRNIPPGYLAQHSARTALGSGLLDRSLGRLSVGSGLLDDRRRRGNRLLPNPAGNARRGPHGRSTG
jgi:hypothetical protein